MPTNFEAKRTSRSVIRSLEETQERLRTLITSLAPEEQTRLERVPLGFLEWTEIRVHHLHFLLTAGAEADVAIESVSLSARLLLEALWTLRWIGSSSDRAREFLAAGWGDMSDSGEVFIRKAKSAGADEIAAGAIENQRGIEADARLHGLDAKLLRSFPVGVDFMEKS